MLIQHEGRLRKRRSEWPYIMVDTPKEGELLGKKQVRTEKKKRQHPEQVGEKGQPKAHAMLP